MRACVHARVRACVLVCVRVYQVIMSYTMLNVGMAVLLDQFSDASREYRENVRCDLHACAQSRACARARAFQLKLARGHLRRTT